LVAGVHPHIPIIRHNRVASKGRFHAIIPVVITPELILLRESTSSDGFPDLSRLLFKDAQLRFERKYFGDLLSRVQGNKSQAAELAGIDRIVLYEYLRKLDLPGAK
jgi:DNA-binding NtrC family response regulator